MQITVPLTLILEVPDADTAAQYLNADGTTREDFIADCFDDDNIYYLLYSSANTEVTAICGKTHNQVKTALASRIP